MMNSVKILTVKIVMNSVKIVHIGTDCWDMMHQGMDFGCRFQDEI